MFPFLLSGHARNEALVDAACTLLRLPLQEKSFSAPKRELQLRWRRGKPCFNVPGHARLALAPGTGAPLAGSIPHTTLSSAHHSTPQHSINTALAKAARCSLHWRSRALTARAGGNCSSAHSQCPAEGSMAGFRPEISGLAVAVAVQLARNELDDCPLKP